MRNFMIFGLFFAIVTIALAVFYKRNSELLEDNSATVKHIDGK